MWDPDTRDENSELLLPATPGSAGSPRSAVCTMVPERPSSRACWTSTSSWAALRGGSESRALAVMAEMADPAVVSSPTATSGASHRSAGRRENTVMRPSCRGAL